MPVKKQQHGLGRGLGALLGEESVKAPDSAEQVVDIPIKLIDTDPDQPRKDFNIEQLSELAQSIRSVGLIQPIIVQPNNGRYTIIAGERRYRACRMAEMDTVRCIVREMESQQRFEATLIENLQRSDLNVIEEAAGLQRLLDETGLTHEEIALRIGRSRSALTNTLRLLNLPESVIKLVRENRLTAGHARALLAADPEKRESLAQFAVSSGLSVRQLEALCNAKRRERPNKPAKDPQIRQLEGMLRRALGMRVRLDGDVVKGRIVLSYSSPDELQKLWDILERLQ